MVDRRSLRRWADTMSRSAEAITVAVALIVRNQRLSTLHIMSFSRLIGSYERECAVFHCALEEIKVEEAIQRTETKIESTGIGFWLGFQTGVLNKFA